MSKDCGCKSKGPEDFVVVEYDATGQIFWESAKMDQRAAEHLLQSLRESLIQHAHTAAIRQLT